jgi:hypothetical protein
MTRTAQARETLVVIKETFLGPQSMLRFVGLGDLDAFRRVVQES